MPKIMPAYLSMASSGVYSSGSGVYCVGGGAYCIGSTRTQSPIARPV